VFSLGAVLYTLLAATNGHAWATGAAASTPTRRSLPVSRTLLAAVAPEPAGRFQSLGDFAAALLDCLDRA
jgi:hypothetical protein